MKHLSKRRKVVHFSWRQTPETKIEKLGPQFLGKKKENKKGAFVILAQKGPCISTGSGKINHVFYPLLTIFHTSDKHPAREQYPVLQKSLFLIFPVGCLRFASDLWNFDKFSPINLMSGQELAQELAAHKKRYERKKAKSKGLPATEKKEFRPKQGEQHQVSHEKLTKKQSSRIKGLEEKHTTFHTL